MGDSMIQVNKIFSNYNVEPIQYKNIAYFATKKIAEYSKTSRLYMGKNFLLKRALEIIKAVNSNQHVNHLNNSQIIHETSCILESNIEKQIFINCFIFNNNEQFIHVLQINDIGFENIENLIKIINQQKKLAKTTKNYEINTKDICNLEEVCNYYNFDNKEIVINKILELYNLQYDLLQEKLSQKSR